MTKKKTATYWKEQLGLVEHVEGGAFKEIYRSPLKIAQSSLTDNHAGDRSVSTSIYFLLTYGEFSAFHRIASDEIWHHYDGGILCIYEIKTNGDMIKHLLGKDMDKGERLQIVIEAGSWFASRVEEEGSFTLCGCTVAPGFDFNDFELANKNQLLKVYPQYKELIIELTKD